MTKRAPESPSEGNPTDASEVDREGTWNRVIDGLEEKQQGEASVLEAARVQLCKQQEALSALLEELGALQQREADARSVLLEGARALKAVSSAADERVKVLERQNTELQGKLDKAELSLVVVREEVSAHEDRLVAIRKEHKRLEAEGEAREQRVQEADAKVAKAEAARKMAADQLNEALESLTEMGLEKADNERRIADLEGGFEAIKEERAGAEERWNATDDDRIKQIRELKSQVEHLETKLKSSEKEQETLASTEQQEREALEQAWKEATAQREALAAVRAESRERIEVLEQQQEEFIANLVDDYDEQLAQAKQELEALRAKGVDDASLKQAQSERDAAREALEALRIELEAARDEAKKAAELETELEALRLGGGDVATEEREGLRRDLERLQSELDEARAGVDQLLTDCDRLNAENVRLTQTVKELEGDRPSIPLDLDDSDGTPDAVGMLEARASSPMLEDALSSGETTTEDGDHQELERLKSELEEAREELERLKVDRERDLEAAVEQDRLDRPGVLVAADRNPVGERRGRGSSSKKRQAKRSARASVRKDRANSSGSAPSKPPPPSSHPDDEREEGPRRAGSYSMIGGEFATETLSGKKKRD
jgi:DNA repair exonuclease SbcCD ATPase subunit